MLVSQIGDTAICLRTLEARFTVSISSHSGVVGYGIIS